VPALILCVVSSRCLSDGFVAFWASTDPYSADYHVDALTKSLIADMIKLTRQLGDMAIVGLQHCWETRAGK